MSKGKVLLIDDEMDFVETLAMRLRTRGYHVEIADGGEGAIEMVRGEHFDAILVDLVMPGMDGIATIKELRRIRPDCQVVLLTGRATVKKATEAMRLGAMDVLEKPFEIDTLLEKIEEAVINEGKLRDRKLSKEIDDIIKKKGW